MNEKLRCIIVASGGALGYLFGGLDILIEVFAMILIIDTITGMLKHYSLGTYESKKFRQGLVKKSGYMLAIILSVQLDKIMGSTGALRSALLFLLISNEGTSIIENLGEIGVPFPEPIINSIAILRNKSKDNSNNNSTK